MNGSANAGTDFRRSAVRRLRHGLTRRCSRRAALSNKAERGNIHARLAAERRCVARRKRPWSSLKTTRSANGPKNTAFFVASASKFDCRSSRRSIMPRTRTVVAPVEKGPQLRNSSPVLDRGMSAWCGLSYGVFGLRVRIGRSSTGGAAPRRTPISRNGPWTPIRPRRNLASRSVAQTRYGERVDADVLCSVRGRADKVRARISHDEWFELLGPPPKLAESAG